MFPDLIPFDLTKRELLEQSLADLSPEQTLWLGGYLTGKASAHYCELKPEQPGNLNQSVSSPIDLLVLFGTESGNSEELAERLGKLSKKNKFKVTIKNMAELSPSDLTVHNNIAVIVSTWGDGEPPETAEGFYISILKEDIDLKGKSYAVFALGDSSYEKFCQTGKDLDRRLENLGCSRLLDRVDCDVEYEDQFLQWSSALLSKLKENNKANANVSHSDSLSADTQTVYDKSNPFPATVIKKINLNGTGSNKETIHLELCLEGSGLEYEVGDALAILPENSSSVVMGFLNASGLRGDDIVELKKIGKMTLEVALRKHLDITALSRKVAKGYQELTSSEKLSNLLSEEKKKEFKEFTEGRQIIDLFEFAPFRGTAQELVSLFRKLPPRLYSISSSLKAVPDEVHLTIAAVRYETHGLKRKGVASTYVADDIALGTKVSIFIQKNKNFRLPEDQKKPIIMIGPGTGVAPFRAFIQERAESSSSGDSWLFFGDQFYSYDFLYQLEWQDALKTGDLTKLEVAFSRDQRKKVYVQDKLKENAAQLWKWLDKDEAYLYVCGDANRMAKDVHNALVEIIQNENQVTIEEAQNYLTKLKKDKRYQRDVY